MTRDDVRAYYQGCGDRGWAQLATAEGSVEFAVNTYAIAAYLPPGARVLDIGGGPGPKGSMMIHKLHYLLLALAVGAALGSAATWSSLAFAGGVPQQHVGVGRNTLLVIDQQGVRSMQVQIGAGHDEIVAVHSNRVPRVLIGGLTVPCCGFGGLAPAPCGRYIAFSQEATAGVHPGRQTAGLWIVTSAGAKLHRLLFPPAPTRLGVSLGIGPVAWSPDGYTLAYAVNGNDVPRPTGGLGIWLS
jgi:hypothetical protein